LTRTGIKAVTIEYEGQVCELNTRPITAAALQGLLAPLLDSVNMVNAPMIARERNIDITEIKHDRASGYQSLICLTVTTEQQSRGVAGTLFADLPRIVRIKDIDVEAELGPHMLYVANEDKPGLIGALGKTLGDAGVNIATFHLGRAAPGGDAIALIQVDEAIPEPVLERVRALPHIKQVATLRF
ncbi:MAG: ACT domain-containing protein, partial [Geminicoccales bacterium]